MRDDIRTEIAQEIESGELVAAEEKLKKYGESGEKKDLDFYILDASIQAGRRNLIGQWNAIKQGLEINPCCGELYWLLGNYYEKIGHPQQAAICMEQAEFYGGEDASFFESEISRIENAYGIRLPKTAIVILSWNLKDYTKQCLDSLRKNVAMRSTQIVVVDNASTDGSVDYLKQQDDIRVIYNSENAGFPRGCNIGIAAADMDADIYLLNNDTIMPPNALFWLRIGLYESETVGSVGSVSNYVSNYQIIQRKWKDESEVLEYALNHNVPMEYPYEPKTYLVGFSHLIKRTVLDKVGLLDELFSPGNSEDVDIGYRICMAGFKNFLCKNSFVFHYGNKSFNLIQDTMDYGSLLKRNHGIMDRKYGWNVSENIYPDGELVDQIEMDPLSEIEVLDLNCSTGATMSRVVGVYPKARVYGITREEREIPIAQSIGKVYCGNPCNSVLPFHEGQFDVIFVSELLETADNPEQFMRKILHFLKPGGKAIVRVRNCKNWTFMLPLLLNDELTYTQDTVLKLEDQRLYTLTTAVHQLKHAGYRIGSISSSEKYPLPDNVKSMVDQLEAMNQTSIKGAIDVSHYLIPAYRFPKDECSMRRLDENKICFITAVNDDAKYKDCKAYIDKLTVPEGMSIECKTIYDGKSMTSAYNQAMLTSDAKYKIYLHQDLMVIEPNFLQILIDMFRKHPEIGIAGVAGSENVPESGVWWDGHIRGQFIDSHTGEMQVYQYEYSDVEPLEVSMLDGLILCTQYDVKWREDLFTHWHFYDTSQTMEFRRAGYQAAIIPSKLPLVEHRCGVVSLQNYGDELQKFGREYM